MNGISKWLSLLFVLLLTSLLGRGAMANTVNAASCSEVDVQTALLSAHSGDTVTIPAGTCAWTTPLTYTAPGSITILGAGNSSVGGGDTTVLIDNVDHSGLSYMINITTAAASSTFRISGVTFEQNAHSTNTDNGIVQVTGNTQNFRMDHSHFLLSPSVSGSTVSLVIDGWMYGVFDHNLFDLIPGSVNNGVRVGEGVWGGGGNQFGNGSWATATNFGSGNFIFMEDNIFNGGSSEDCNDGGRIVFRYNTMNVTFIQTHEMENDYRGCRAIEVYHNVSSGSTSTPVDGDFIQTRMGTALVWANVTTNNITLLDMEQDRTNSGHGQYSPPNGWGYCGTTLGPSMWDQNSNSSGYPCVDQVGRGKGDMFSGAFPSKLNSTKGAAGSPNQALEPVYEWLDQWNPAKGQSGLNCYSGDTNTIAPNRDFYCYTMTWSGSAYTGTAFNGTVGTGSGALSARPTTCTTNVAYWATDTNTLYQCATANTWSSYYTPFSYPHPLTQGSVASGAPAPPSNVKASVQ